jgi:hypothetical protein
MPSFPPVDERLAYIKKGAAEIRKLIAAAKSENPS